MTGEEGRPQNTFDKIAPAIATIATGPAVWIRENIVDKNRPTYDWYHRKFRRVPTIDECYSDDIVCFIEANEQFKRDKLVDSEVLSILRTRHEDCVMYEGPGHLVKCAPLLETYEVAAANWFSKYGDLGIYGTVKDAYMKQKHRMVWERRHGPIGSGMKAKTVE